MIKLVEILVDSRYDKMSSLIVRDILTNIKKSVDKKYIWSGVYDFGEDDDFTVICKLNKVKSLLTPIEYNVDAEYNYNTNDSEDEITVDIKVITDSIPAVYSNKDFKYDLLDAVRHEIEHYIQNNYTGITPLEFPEVEIDPNTSHKTNMSYFLDKLEIPAFVAGFHLKSKRKRKSTKKLMGAYLDVYVKAEQLDQKEKDFILQEWMKWNNKVYHPHKKNLE